MNLTRIVAKCLFSKNTRLVLVVILLSCKQYIFFIPGLYIIHLFYGNGTCQVVHTLFIVFWKLVVFIHDSNQPPPRHNACCHEIPLQTNKNGSSYVSKYRQVGFECEFVKAPAEYLPSVCPQRLPPYP